MAVQSGAYKHPSTTTYSQGMRDVIDACLKVDPRERPDIHKVRLPLPCLSNSCANDIPWFTAYRVDGCCLKDPFVVF